MATTARLVIQLKLLDRLGAAKAAVETAGNSIKRLAPHDDHSDLVTGMGDALESDLAHSLKDVISKMEIVVQVIDKVAAVRKFLDKRATAS
jgi:CII-binding regulator of phage lambda lysogenization HflD